MKPFFTWQIFHEFFPHQSAPNFTMDPNQLDQGSVSPPTEDELFLARYRREFGSGSEPEVPTLQDLEREASNQVLIVQLDRIQARRENLSDTSSGGIVFASTSQESVRDTLIRYKIKIYFPNKCTLSLRACVRLSLRIIILPLHLCDKMLVKMHRKLERKEK